MKTENKATTPTATTTPFATAILNFNNDPDNPETILTLATAVAYAVTKKIEQTTADPTIKALRLELAYEMKKHRNANDSNDPHENSTSYGCYIGDSYDLVQTAVIAIIEERDRQRATDQTAPIDFEKPYSVRRLKRKVYIQTADSVRGYETAETTPIQEVYKAVRRFIDSSRAIQTDPRNGYTYLEDLATDPDNPDSIETVYRRLPKYADIGGRVVDFNGKETTPTTADRETVDNLFAMIDRLELTDRQKTALVYRLRGYGYKAIATALGIRPDSVRDVFKAIQKKADKIGLTVK